MRQDSFLSSSFPIIFYVVSKEFSVAVEYASSHFVVLSTFSLLFFVPFFHLTQQVSPAVSP